ncbi:Ig-like domain-containing protein, partial [Marinomonas sp. BSi20584]|uniref:Ig-like domain-containing protein n=1 Tax=Marinomonas sp. BSi20584 TaxID=1594462 RepID=UPI000CC3B2C0
QEWSYTLDTTAPTNKVESLTFSKDTGSSTTDLITNQESQTVTGTLINALAEGESLWILQNETSFWVDASGAVDGKAVNLGELQLESGTHTVKAQVRDTAGNVSKEQEWTYTLDTTDPTAAEENPIIVDISNGAGTGTLDAGDTVTISFSEAVKVGDLFSSEADLSQFALTNSHTWGVGATVKAVDATDDGYAASYTITLGTGATVKYGDAVTTAAGATEDRAGNENTDNVQVLYDPTVVVFNLTSGESSDHSGRVFDANTSYTIYLVVDSVATGSSTLATGSRWGGWGSIGRDDMVVLVGSDGAVKGKYNNDVTNVWANSYGVYWQSARARVVAFSKSGLEKRGVGSTASNVRLAEVGQSAWASVPNQERGANFSENYKTALPTSIANSQPMS